MQKITTQLKFNNGALLEFFVLKMLSSRTHSLKEISAELKHIGFPAPSGSLYPLMSTLRRKNLVGTGYEEMDSDGPAKTYDLTKGGSERLQELKRDWKHLNATVASLGKNC